MLRARMLMLVAIGSGMRQVTLLHQMHRVLDDFGHTRGEDPQEQGREAGCERSAHGSGDITAASANRQAST